MYELLLFVSLSKACSVWSISASRQDCTRDYPLMDTVLWIYLSYLLENTLNVAAGFFNWTGLLRIVVFIKQNLITEY